METFRNDLKYAVRALAKNPGFAVLTISCLALGIGVNSTIFSVVDTVAIRPLPFRDPHQLVAAFKATLEELAEADLLIHVVDASHPGLDDQMAAVEGLLAELELAERPSIVALNKVDRLDHDSALDALTARFNGVALSARTGQGAEALLERIGQHFRPRTERLRLLIPYRDGPALALCYERGRVLSRADLPEGIRVEVEVPRRLAGQLETYRRDD